MSNCSCGRNGWFSPPDPGCPEHGTHGKDNHDYQRGLAEAQARPVPSESSLIKIVHDVLDGCYRLSGSDADALTAEIARRFSAVRR